MTAKPITIHGKSFTKLKDVCKVNPNTYIQKRKVPRHNYVYARVADNDEWKECHDNDKDAEILLVKEYVDENFVGIETEKNGTLAIHAERCMKRCTTPISCIYLFSLGHVKNIRECLSISKEVNDELLVYKYGMTKNLAFRMKEHMNDYGKLNNVVVRLVLFSLVDPSLISNAEGDIRFFFNNTGMKLVVPGRNELIVCDNKQFKLIENQYRLISVDYSSKHTELFRRIADLEHDVQIKTLELEKCKIELSMQTRIHDLEINAIQLKSQT